MLDGYIARKTNSVTRLGSLLDTIADTVFLIICFIKILPYLSLTLWVIIWIIIIALIKLSTIIKNYKGIKNFSVIHASKVIRK